MLCASTFQFFFFVRSFFHSSLRIIAVGLFVLQFTHLEVSQMRALFDLCVASHHMHD